MTILCFDTALDDCNVAVFDSDSEIAAAHMLSLPYGQGEHLMPLIARTLAEANKSYPDLKTVLVTCGPGGFTGLRVGLAAAQGLALALRIPIYGISTLQALALSAQKHKHGNGLVAVDTKRGDFYTQVFDAAGAPLNEGTVCTAPQVETMLQAYNAHRLEDKHVNCTHIARLYAGGARQFFKENPAPLYLRPPEISQSKQPQRTLEAKAGNKTNA